MRFLHPVRWALLLACASVMLGSGPPVHAANLAQGKPTKADQNDTTSNTPSKNITDNNFTTEWNNGGSGTGFNNWVGVDLGSAVTPKYARIQWSGAGEPKGFYIEAAPAGTAFPTTDAAWTVIYEHSSSDPFMPNPSLCDLQTNTTPYQYYRVHATDVNLTGQNGWGVFEFQLLDSVPATIKGTVTANGSPIANALVELVGPAAVTNGPAPIEQAMLTNADGTYSIQSTYPGTYSVLAMVPTKWAPVKLDTFTVADGTDISGKDVPLVQPVVNNTAPMPAYDQDFIAGPDNMTDGNATSYAGVLPSDELPPGDAIWTTGDPNAFPAGAPGMSPGMPAGLKFWMPPTADGQNNVVRAQGATIPMPAGNYAALYFLQVGGDAVWDTTAFLNYADGTTVQALSSTGSTTYRFTDGLGLARTEDEIDAFTVDKLYNTGSGTAVLQNFRVFMHILPVDLTKTLKSVTFGYGASSNSTISKGYILAYSADTLAAVPAVGSITGIVNRPVSEGNGPANRVFVKLGSFTYVTGADGRYTFRGVAPDAYKVTASVPGLYPATSINLTVNPGDNLTSPQTDIQLPAKVGQLAQAVTGPTLDMVSTDQNFPDFGATGNCMGAEYMPTGLYNPTMPNPPADPTHFPGYPTTVPWQADTKAPINLKMRFAEAYPDTVDASGNTLTPLSNDFPYGATPNGFSLHDYEILAPMTKVYNAYLGIIGVTSVVNFTPTLHYADGTSETVKLANSDWFQNPSPYELPYIIMHARHNTTGETSNIPPSTIRLNALVVPCNPNKVLHDIAFDHGDQQIRYPTIFAVTWETVDQQPAEPSDIRVKVVDSTNTPVAGAWVVYGPYSLKTTYDGTAIFRSVFANQNINITAFQSGVTKPTVLNIPNTPSGQFMPAPYDVTIQLPADSPTFVQLPMLYDYDNIATTDMPGDYHAQAISGDAALPAEKMPTSNTIIKENGIDFLMPFKEAGYVNQMRENGQTLKVVPGHYSAFDFIALGQGVGNGADPTYHALTLNYADGTSDQVQTANEDWTVNQATPAARNKIFYRQQYALDFFANYRRRYQDDPANSNVGFFQQIVPVDASKVLTSISMQPIAYGGIGSRDMSYLCATLEAKDFVTDSGTTTDISQASATITGTVTGRPMGADGNPVGTDQPIGRAQVYTDPAHCVYTNADGTFTLKNVPLSSTSITVLPLGTGILTKSFPVTLTAGSNGPLSLNVGSAVTTIYCVLGDPNQDFGIHHVYGLPFPYALDSGRPNNFATVTDSVTSPITIGGRNARVGTYASDYFYFQLDHGWLFRGYQGTNGLDTSTFATGTSFPATGKVAPHVYMQITYYDRGTDPLSLNYNRMQGAYNSKYALNTYNMVDSYKNPQSLSGTTASDIVITKTNTNTWKSFVYDLNPFATTTTTSDAFGAYGGENLESDFRINPRQTGTNPAEIIYSVAISTQPFTTPSPQNIMRIVAGLVSAQPSDLATMDWDGDHAITLMDATKMVRSTNGL